MTRRHSVPWEPIAPCAAFLPSVISLTAALALSAALSLGAGTLERASAQSVPTTQQQFYSNGADAMRLPQRGEPGSERFTNGAESNGADRMTVGRPGSPNAAFYTNGAALATVPSGSQYY